jgi:integrase
MSVERITRKSGAVRYRVRWREHGRNRAETFDRRRDAELFEGDIRRRRQLGTLAQLDAGTETLDDYVSLTWAPTHAAGLAPRTRGVYAFVYDRHVSPHLGAMPLRDITPETIAQWQSGRVSAGVKPHAVRKAVTLLGSILQRAAEAQRIPFNPARIARKAKLPASRAVRPLSPSSVEAIRQAILDPPAREVAESSAGRRSRQRYQLPDPGTPQTRQRDATLVSVLAYAGLRPGEALDLRWGDVLEQTLVVSAPKTGRRRNVRLLRPLASDLAAWRLASGSPQQRALVFPSAEGTRWTDEAYKSWTRHAFRRAAAAAGVPDATPYSLRHSFVSLLLAEGRHVLDVAQQAGHKASLSLDTYGHLFAEFDGRAQVEAEGAIRAAREAITTAADKRVEITRCRPPSPAEGVAAAG